MAAVVGGLDVSTAGSRTRGPGFESSCLNSLPTDPAALIRAVKRIERRIDQFNRVLVITGFYKQNQLTILLSVQKPNHINEPP